MKNKTLIVLSIIVACGFCAGIGSAEGIEISAEISSPQIAFEERDTLSIKISWTGPESRYSVINPPEPEIDKMKRVGSTTGTVHGGDSMATTTRIYRFILSPIDYGAATVEPVVVAIRDNVSGEEIALETARLVIDIDRPSAGVTFPIPTTVLIIAALIAIITIAVFVTLALTSRSRKKQPVEPKSYLDQLDDAGKLIISDPKQYYSRISILIVGYIEQELGVTVSGKTPDEQIAALDTLDDKLQRDKIAGFISHIAERKYQPVINATAAEDFHSELIAFFQKLEVEG